MNLRGWGALATVASMVGVLASTACYDVSACDDYDMHPGMVSVVGCTADGRLELRRAVSCRPSTGTQYETMIERCPGDMACVASHCPAASPSSPSPLGDGSVDAADAADGQPASDASDASNAAAEDAGAM